MALSLTPTRTLVGHLDVPSKILSLPAYMDAHFPETLSYQIIYKLHPNEDKVYLFLHKSQSSGVQPWSQFFFSTYFTACKFFSNSLGSSSLGNRSQVTSTKVSNFCNAWTEKVKLLDSSLWVKKRRLLMTIPFFGTLRKHKDLYDYPVSPFNMTKARIWNHYSRYDLIFESRESSIKLWSILVTAGWLWGHLPFETKTSPPRGSAS